MYLCIYKTELAKSGEATGLTEGTTVKYIYICTSIHININIDRYFRLNAYNLGIHKNLMVRRGKPTT